MPRGPQKLSPKRVFETQRAAAAVELRRRGKEFQEIADLLGYAGRNGAYLAVQRALLAVITQPAQELVAEEILRLNALLDAVWDRAMTGDPKSVTACLSVMARRAKLLGLDKAVTQNINVNSQSAIPTIPDNMELPAYLQQVMSILEATGASEITVKQLESGEVLEAGFSARLTPGSEEDQLVQALSGGSPAHADTRKVS